MQQAPVFWRRALELIDGLCAATTQARSTNAELDLHPERVFVEHEPGALRRIKLLDATIERLRGDEPRDTAQFGLYGDHLRRRKDGLRIDGAFHYFSPEKLMGKPLTPASDVYVLGVVAFELITGRTPFADAKGPAGLITAQLKLSPPLPSDLIPELPPDVDHVILKSLRKDRAQRFEDSAALRRAIAEISKRTASQLSPERAAHDELERAIADAPRSLEGYEVYGDWLQEQGDPRGELIALQVAAERLSLQGDHVGAEQRRAQTSAFLDANTAFLLGPLRKHAVRNRRGVDPFHWRCGFIQGLALDRDVAEVLEAVVRHPSGRFVTDLELSLEEAPSTTIGRIERLVPATLRSLTLRSTYELGPLTDLLRLAPRLEALSVTAPGFELERLELPELDTLVLRSGRMELDNVAALAKMACPRMRSLTLRLGDSSPILPPQLEPLLSRTDLPELEALAINAWGHAGALCQQLVTTPIGQQLTELDLSWCRLDETALHTLAQLPNLRTVMVSIARRGEFPFEIRIAPEVDPLLFIDRWR